MDVEGWGGVEWGGVGVGRGGGGVEVGVGLLSPVTFLVKNRGKSQ